jgi:outer membrane protein assembly factor BamB
VIPRALIAPIVGLILAIPHAQAAPAPAEPGHPAPLGPEAGGGLAHTPVADVGTSCGITSLLPNGEYLSTSCEEEASADGGAATAGGDDLTLEAAREVGTVRWFADLAPRGDGSFVRVHGYGDVVAAGADGAILWRRPASSLYPDWGVESPLVPIVPLGESPTNAATRASDRPYAVGDVTGDGLEDIAVSHFVTYSETESLQRRVAQVTILDGTDGATLWTRRLPGFVTQVVLDGDLLVLGHETGDESGTSLLYGEDGSRSSVLGLRLTPAGDGLAAEEAWRVETDLEFARWIAAEPAGEGRLAVSRASGTGGVVFAIDLATGDVLWQQTTTGSPMNLRYDASRDLVVVHEQTSPASASTSYRLSGLAAADGSSGPSISRTGALLLSLEVADVTGGPELEWLTGDLARLQDESSGTTTTTMWAGRVRAADPAAGTLWTHETLTGEDLMADRTGGTSVPEHFGLTAAGDHVITGWFSVRGTGLAALDGDDGTVAWERFGDPAYPLFLTPHALEGTDVVLAARGSKATRAYRVSDGAVAMVAPALADVYAVESVDVNADGTRDLVVGGEGEGVFALDGTELDDDPGILWQAATEGPVHQLHLADLDGDGADELVAVASWGVDVLGLADGNLRYRIPVAEPDIAWAVTIGDLNGDQKPDLLVPTRRLRAYGGADGSMLWQWPSDAHDRAELRFAAPAIEDGIVVTQFLKRALGNPAALEVNPRGERFTVGLRPATGAVAWLVPQVDQVAIPRLWRGVLGTPQGVATTWETARAGVPVELWKVQTDVLDPATGAVVSSTRLAEGQTHTFLVQDTEFGLFEGNWLSVAKPADDPPLEIDMPGSSWEAGYADFGELGRFFLMGGAWTLRAYPPELPLGGAGTLDPPVVAEWGAVPVSKFEVTDHDGDGADEVIAFRMDFPMYVEVHRWEGTQTFESDDKLHGVAVLEAE